MNEPNLMPHKVSCSQSDTIRPTWAEVDFGALVHNYRTLQTLVCPAPQFADLLTTPEPRLFSVVKTNAYGHGSVPVARALAQAGADAFAVALVEEGIVLRHGGIEQEILVLQGAWPGQEEEAVRNRLTVTVFSPESVRRLDEAARKSSAAVRVHIKIDTGFTRLGVPWDAMEPLLEALHRAGHLRLTGTFSHLTSSEEEDQSFTREQIRRFRAGLASITRAGMNPGELHFSNSGGMLYCKDLRGLTARPGIALYGYAPVPERSPVSLKPALTLKTRIGRIHEVRPGESVGYNRTFFASRPTRAATLPIGYADGYRRDLTGRGKVIIRDRYASLIGKVSMDMCVADVTDLPEARVGDEVILLGSSEHCSVDADVWSNLLRTIPNDVLTGLGPRIPRIYVSPSTS
jgi:alanine racemase